MADDVETCSLIKTSNSRINKHPSGFYTIISCPITRSGIYLYEDSRYESGIRRELRPHEEVFNEKSLATLDSLPITLLHPSVGVVTSHNFRGVDFIGSTHPEIEIANISQEEKLISDGIIRAKLTLYDGRAIDKFKNKEFTGFSLGYNCKRHYEPGIINGQAYDSYQSDIVYNHLAAVEYGRYGMTVSDNFSTVDGFDFNTNTSKKYFDMKQQLSEIDELKTTLNATKQALEQQKNDNSILHDKITELENQQKELVTKDSVGEVVKQKLNILSLAQLAGDNVTADSVVENHEAVIDSLFSRVAPNEKGLSFSEKIVYLNALKDNGYFNKRQTVGDSLTRNTINNKQPNTQTQNRFELMRNEYLKSAIK